MRKEKTVVKGTSIRRITKIVKNVEFGKKNSIRCNKMKNLMRTYTIINVCKEY